MSYRIGDMLKYSNEGAICVITESEWTRKHNEYRYRVFWIIEKGDYGKNTYTFQFWNESLIRREFQRLS